MNYPADVLFDIETLVNIAQPQNILLLGDTDSTFLDQYLAQKTLINQNCQITQLKNNQLDEINNLSQTFEVGIAINLFEHIDKVKGEQLLSRLRDVLTKQYCICLPVTTEAQPDQWQLTELFSFALQRVACYKNDELEYGLFKYNINAYKQTPDWLNADNWANPNMWNKYRW